MQARVNTDIAGGIAVLAIGAFFQLQITEELTPYGAFFPQKILWLLFACGVLLLGRGIARSGREKKLVFRVNGNMLTAMLTGALWAATLDWLGFIASGSLALGALALKYLPLEKRTIANICANCAGVVGCVLLFWWLFTSFLGVTLPKGRIFDLF